MGGKFWATVALAFAVTGGVAQAAQGDWLARARVINISPDASSSALNLDASNETTLELDFTYFVTRNIGLELILATKKHTITSNSAGCGRGCRRRGLCALLPRR